MPKKPQRKPARPTKSARIFVDLHHRLDIYRAQQKRPFQDVLNEAVEEYLTRKRA